MTTPTRTHESPFRVWDFFVVIGITFGVVAVGSIAAVIVALPNLDDLSDPMAIVGEPVVFWSALVLQWVGSFVGLLVVKAYRRATIEDFGLPITSRDATGILWGLGAVGALVAIGAVLQAMGLEAPEQDSVAALGAVDGPLLTLVAIVGVGVVGPLTEELMYRGVLQGSLTRRFAVMPSIVIASAIFAVSHYQPGVPAPALLAVLLLPIFLLSITLGWLVERDGGRIGRAFFMHATFNAVQVALVLIGVSGI
jgi:membrane protease YdiL (CAAX protease family)